MIFLDVETVGFHGPIVLLQWAEDDGPIHLHCPWKVPIRETMDLIEYIVNREICGFNLAFDFFHICQMYTVLDLIPNKDQDLEDAIEQYADLEPLGRDGPCLKPKAACDIMLHARRGPYQSTMDREEIRIRRVPTVLVHQLARELERRIKLKDIYFARKKDKNAPKWVVYDIEDWDGTVNPEFKDIVLRFHPSSALKALAADALQIPIDEILMFDDVNVDERHHPEEYGFAPFALAVGNKSDWKGAWPEKINYHITHWAYNERARKYATKDVEYTRDLYKFFGSPKAGDVDSELACMVAAVRWRKFAVDIPGLKQLQIETKERTKIKDEKGKEWKIPTAPAESRKYITAVCSEVERENMKDEKGSINESTKRVILESISKWKGDCDKCNFEGCPECPPHPAAMRARQVLDARMANYENDLYEKFIIAGGFHASFNVIGALSSRMSGTDGLNAQGIKNQKTIRSKFPLAKSPMILCGGDFSGFEVTIAEAVYSDEGLREDLKSGKKIHGLFGQFVFAGHSYEEIVASEGKPNDMYTNSKRAVFAMFYGGTEHTLCDRLGVTIEVAMDAKTRFHNRYPGVGREEKMIEEMFSSIRQRGGIGSKVSYHQPADYVESLLGFRRYFTLENEIIKALFELANDPPKEWRLMNVKVQRRDRVQTAGGALQSALYGGAFGIQSGIIRAARNHRIQSTGAGITKGVQIAIWSLQPYGVNEWYVQSMNVHDEIMCVTRPELAEEVKKLVDEAVESYRPIVPLIKMDWKAKLETWADKS